MKRKWYRIEDINPESSQDFHCWGEKVGLDVCYIYRNEFYCCQNPLDKRYTHVMPFPVKPKSSKR